jgi:hypothetical protein
MTTKQKQIVDTAAPTAALQGIPIKTDDQIVTIATVDTGDNV